MAAPGKPPADRDDPRWRRLHGSVEDQRHPAEKDRDRILYTSALRRLAGVTQVVAATEGHSVHNRLTHSLEVAQIARRLAEYLLDIQPTLARFGLDPDVVESASLAHDLGHPPFGHVSEKVLDRLVTEHDCPDGFEGNAQSFRIVAELSVCGETDARAGQYGLDLTSATLDAILKYPWARNENPEKLKKWGYYRSEVAAFAHARRMAGGGTKRPSLEAQVMTLADDIAYSVHDTEDFFRAGLVPLDRLVNDRGGSNGERSRFLEAASTALKKDASDCRAILETYLGPLAIDQPYRGTRSDRVNLRRTTSSQIGRYLLSARVVDDSGDEPLLQLHEPYEDEIELAKQLTWYYVIDNPSLATQQAGTRKLIEALFHTYFVALDPKSPEVSLIPAAFREQAQEWITRGGEPSHERARLASDIICNMTDHQALCMFQRVSGHSPGTIFDPSFR